MKLRIARKIVDAVGTDRESAYTLQQIGVAISRVERMKSSRESQAFWNAMMRQIGPEGRAQIVKSWSPAKAFRILMEECR